MQFYPQECSGNHSEKMFAKLLAETFHVDEGVCYSAWNTGCNNREADFVVLHPDYGLWIFEVKAIPIDQIAGINNDVLTMSPPYFNRNEIQPLKQLKLYADDIRNRLDYTAFSHMKDQVKYYTSTRLVLPKISFQDWKSSGYNEFNLTQFTLFSGGLQPSTLRDMMEKQKQHRSEVMSSELYNIISDILAGKTASHIRSQNRRYSATTFRVEVDGSRRWFQKSVATQNYAMANQGKRDWVHQSTKDYKGLSHSPWDRSGPFEKKYQKQDLGSKRVIQPRSTERSEPDAESFPFPIYPGDNVVDVEINSGWVGRQRLLADTDCFCASGAYSLFTEKLAPLLSEQGKYLLISERSIHKLKKGQANGQKPAHDGLAIVTQLVMQNALIHASDPHPIPGDPLDTFGLFTEILIGFQLSADLALMTQCERLALQVIKNSRSGAFQYTKKVSVYYVEDGSLKNWVPRLLSRFGYSDSLAKTVMDIEPQVVSECKILVDTSTLMLHCKDETKHIAQEFFVTHLLPLLKTHGNPLIVPAHVIRELEKHANADNDRRARQAQAARDILNSYRAADLLVVGEDSFDQCQEKTRNFADPIFVKVAIRFQAEFNLCILTQDTNLAKLLLSNHNAGSKHHYFITYLDQRHGQLRRWESRLLRMSRPAGADAGAQFFKSMQFQSARKINPVPKPKQDGGAETAKKHSVPFNTSDTKTRPAPQPFAITSQLAPLNHGIVTHGKLPTVGCAVHVKGRSRAILIKELAQGGEGIIYNTDQADVVCKIYHENCLTQSRYDKLKLMLSHDVNIKGVCWPLEIVENERGDFVGYLMPKAAGKILKTAVLAKPLLLKSFPKWTRIELTQLAHTILSTIQELHAMNILLGDINPQNILVVNEREIHLVDTDSFQIEGFPCPVGTETFTPPNLQGQNFGAFLRSKEDELFAVATLLFMILFIGKAPYSSQGGGEAAENIRNMRFPYVRQEGEKNIKPVGAWQFIWSHLSTRMKSAFTRVFSLGERVSIQEFLVHLNYAMNDMKSGTLNSELFPEQPKLRQGATAQVVCYSCPTESNSHEISINLYNTLVSENRNFLCSKCAGLKTMDRLANTREIKCEICGTLVSDKTDFLKSLADQGRQYHCRACRTSRYTQPRSYVSGRGFGHGRFRPRRQKVSACFVATATYQSDSAAPVVFLRTYRDQYLSLYRAGRAFIAIYYILGPYLAALVNQVPILRRPSRFFLDHLIAYLARRYPIFPKEESQHGG